MRLNMRYKKLFLNRLVLRKFQKSDIDFILKHFSDAEVTKFLYDQEPLRNMQEAQKLLEWVMDTQSGDHVRWCITLKNEPIGTCGFHLYNPKMKSAEIGYDLGYGYWNNGYMSEALQAILCYAKLDLQLHTINACVALENIASQKLLQKRGFILLKTEPKKHLFRGKYYAHHIYSLTL